MAKESKKALVPRLRFPEFLDDPEWADATLEELITTVTPPAKLPSSNYRKFGKFPIVDQSQQAICGWTDDASAVIEDAWPLIVFGDHTCALKLIRQPFAQGADGIKIFKAKTGLSTEYLFHSLNHRPLEMEDYKRHFSILKERRVFRPGLETGEQQKITDCLSSLDALIAAQGRKVEALKTYKRGLMQQLFPREGETFPRLRFPEFRDVGDWKPKTLGDVVEVASGQVDPTQSPYCDFPQIGSENIESDSGKLIAVKSAREKGVISGNYAFDEKDVLYSKIRPALNKAATPAFEGICSADIYPIRPKNDCLLRIFLLYLILSPRFLDYAISKSERGKIPKINRDDLLSFEAVIPPPLEQQRIANCLTSLDTLITAATQELETLKTQKKGLMQQLFPSPVEA